MCPNQGSIDRRILCSSHRLIDRSIELLIDGLIDWLIDHWFSSLVSEMAAVRWYARVRTADGDWSAWSPWAWMTASRLASQRRPSSSTSACTWTGSALNATSTPHPHPIPPALSSRNLPPRTPTTISTPSIKLPVNAAPARRIKTLGDRNRWTRWRSGPRRIHRSRPSSRNWRRRLPHSLRRAVFSAAQDDHKVPFFNSFRSISISFKVLDRAGHVVEYFLQKRGHPTMTSASDVKRPDPSPPPLPVSHSIKMVPYIRL